MVRRTSLRALSSAVLFALLVTALHPQPAWAEEGTPPPADPTATETAPPPVDETGADPAVPAVEPAAAPGVPVPATDILPPVDASGEPVDDASGDPPSEPAPADLLAQVPDGTSVAVVDAQGAVVPLVSQQAAEIVASGDPIWCPASVSAPTPGLGGCTGRFNSFAALIAALPAVVPADGIIWFEDSYDSGNIGADPGVALFTLNGATTHLALAPFKLTLRGGWDGVSGSSAIVPGGSSEFNGRLEILNWQNDVTLSDLVITGTTGSYALHVSQAAASAGNITLTRVNSHHNAQRGARLNNSLGTGKVTITSSQFNSNSNGGGLEVISKGAITLASLTVIDNLVTNGAWLDNADSTTNAKVSITSSQFNNNGSTGLTVYSKGAISLANVTATHNNLDRGAMLDNSYSDTVGGITFTGVNTFDDNWHGGLYAMSHGAILANDLSASGNGRSGVSGDGAELYNDLLGVTAGITLTGTNIFTDNHNWGLNIVSYGPIALNNVIANSNVVNDGASVINAGAVTAQPVTLTGSSTFKYNGQHGLYLTSNGKISLNNLIANVNGVSGALLDNSLNGFIADVTLTGASTFNANDTHGLYVFSLGAIKAANLTANDNGTGGFGHGAELRNSSALSAKGVTLTGSNTFNGNYSSGLNLTSRGAVSINNLTASANIHGAGAGVDNTNTLLNAPQKVSLSGSNVFEDNYSSGLALYSKGAITVNGLRATGNGILANSGDGVTFFNDNASSPQPVSLTGVNRIADNNNDGLSIYSKGTISAANLTVTGNGVAGGAGHGAFFTNTAGSTAGVTVSGTNIFSDNYGTGLWIASNGALSLSSTTASGNVHGYGIALDNNTAPPSAPQNVTLSGSSTAEDNYFSGLQITSYGTITLSSLTSNRNGITGSLYGHGISLYNGGGSLARAVTLSGTIRVSGNQDYGLNISSLGAIKVNNLTASENRSYGAYLENVSGTAAVTLTGASTIRDNWSDGLRIPSHGAIGAANLTVEGNGGYGVYLDNSWSVAAGVTFTGINTFTGNYTNGLRVWTQGAITISNLQAGETQHGDGAALNNNLGATSAQPSVTLTGLSTFFHNYGNGLNIISFGAVDIKTTSFQTEGNGIAGGYGNGLHIDNSGGAVPKNVSLAGTSLLTGDNSGGLSIYSKGAIKANNVTATDSPGGSGASLYNVYLGASGGITLTGTNIFEDNAYDGFNAQSMGAISVNNLTGSRNGAVGGYGNGAVLDNVGTSAAMAVKLTGTNTFNDNYSHGLSAISNGAISANNLTANRNLHGAGAYLWNSHTNAGALTLTGSNTFQENRDSGLVIESQGAISLNSLTANGNGQLGLYGFGANIHNQTSATPQTVKLTGTNTFNDNYSGGLFVQSRGAISANNLTANHTTAGNGVHLFNNTVSAGVTLTGTNAFLSNAVDGLTIESDGAVSLTKVTADDNTAYGVYIFHPSSITLTCGSMTSNGSVGLYAHTSGVLTLIGVVASGNAPPGMDLSGSLRVDIRACSLP